MKSNPKIILMMVCLFLVAQMFALMVGRPFVEYTKQVYPNIQAQAGTFSLTFMFTLVAVSVVLIILIKLKLAKVWLAWFGVAMIFAMSITLSVILPNDILAITLAVILAFLKFRYRDNIPLHNVVQILTLTGIALIFSPVLTVGVMIALLAVISVYDILSVFFTKHMVYMAEENQRLGLFPGLVVQEGGERAILGGGDVGFMMMFALTVASPISSFFIVYGATIGLLFLYLAGKRKKYYPAMPVLTASSVIGLAVSLLII